MLGRLSIRHQSCILDHIVQATPHTVVINAPASGVRECLTMQLRRVRWKLGSWQENRRAER